MSTRKVFLLYFYYHPVWQTYDTLTSFGYTSGFNADLVFTVRLAHTDFARLYNENVMRQSDFFILIKRIFGGNTVIFLYDDGFAV